MCFHLHSHRKTQSRTHSQPQNQFFSRGTQPLVCACVCLFLVSVMCFGVRSGGAGGFRHPRGPNLDIRGNVGRLCFLCPISGPLLLFSLFIQLLSSLPDFHDSLIFSVLLPLLPGLLSPSGFRTYFLFSSLRNRKNT